MKRGPYYLKPETQWLRGYARTYLPSHGALEFSPETFHLAGIDLLDFICLAQGGLVTFSDKLDGPGALWIVDGYDCDRNHLRATLIVETQQMSIRVEDVERVQREQGEKIAAAG